MDKYVDMLQERLPLTAPDPTTMGTYRVNIVRMGLLAAAVSLGACLGPHPGARETVCGDARLIIVYADTFATDPSTCMELEDRFAGTAVRESNGRTIERHKRPALPAEANAEDYMALCLRDLDLLEHAVAVLSASRPDFVLILVESGADSSNAQRLMRDLGNAGVCASVGRNPRTWYEPHSRDDR
jgi:hypothetical protein